MELKKKPKQWFLKCPKYHQHNGFALTAKKVLFLNGDADVVDEDKDFDYGADSPMQCAKCDLEGTMATFMNE